MEEVESGDYATRSVAFLREVCRDSGTVNQRITAVAQSTGTDELELFMVETREQLLAGITATAKFEPNEVRTEVNAFLNALGYRTDGSAEELPADWNLTRRRKEYLAAHTDVTERTLIRHEIKGAELLSGQILAFAYVVRSYQLNQLKGFDSEERVKKLERMLFKSITLISSLIDYDKVEKDPKLDAALRAWMGEASKWMGSLAGEDMS